jgi:hypothetical protein
MATLTLVGITAAGALALRPVRAPEESPQPLLHRMAVLRHAVAQEPENPALLLQLSRAEFRVAHLAAVRDYAARYPEGISPEPIVLARRRYEAWIRGSLHVAPGGRRAQALARKAAERARTAELRAEAYLMLGAVAWERGQEGEAIRAFRAACRARPDWAPGWMRLAAASQDRGDAATVAYARQRLERLRADTPEDSPVELFSLGVPSAPLGAAGATE